MKYPRMLSTLALGLSTLMVSQLAQATCQPPPSPVIPPYNLANDEQKLGFIPQLTGPSIDYSCPSPRPNPDGSIGYDIRHAYYFAFVLNKSIVHSLSDAEMQAIGLGGHLVASTGSVSQAAPWVSETIYQQGNKVQWQGVEYTAQWWTQGETPGSAQGAWLKAVSNTPTAWDAAQVYQANSKAISGNKVWQARWWNQNEVPGSNEWGAWQATNEALPTSGVGRYSAMIRAVNGGLAINVQAAHSNSTPPAYIELRENGLAIGRLSEFPKMAVDCQVGDTHCAAGVYWTSTATIQASAFSTPFKYYSLWACSTETQCRPTKLTTFFQDRGIGGSASDRTTTIHPSEPFPLRD
ncbi:carbohydrate-binding protein [Deefgea rivuli]|uniref:carbohydrate-binding protein n=1 Tax=Deefgea rivuli TaxID=400948 RepID=UPI0004824434|nr:carbohydrate-binding protein [Deefgea rivuli]